MSQTYHSALLHVVAHVRHRVDSVDAHGDVITTETVIGPIVCHAYQRWRSEFTDAQVIGVEELVVHLMADVEVTVGDRIDMQWPDHRTVEAEVIGPPARRINARNGKVHHVEVRTREIR